MKVAKRIPKPSEMAIGFRNCAWIARSNISGTSPTKVVSEVRKMGRKRLTPEVSTA